MNTEMKELEDLQERLEAINREFDLLKKQLKTEQDWPQKRDGCWTFDSSGKVFHTEYDNGNYDTRRKENNMYFRTEEAATLARDQGLAYRKLWELADGSAIIIKKLNGCYYFDNYDSTFGIPKFSTKEKAMEAVAEIGEELLDTIFDQE